MTEMPHQPFNTFNPADEPGAVAPGAVGAANGGKRTSFDNASEPIRIVIENFP